MSTRTDIRNAIANALTGASVVPTANILQGRNNTLASISFPSCAIYAVHEDIEVRTLAPSNRDQYRVLQVIVEYFTAQTSTTAIDTLFDWCGGIAEYLGILLHVIMVYDNHFILIGKHSKL